MNSPFNCLIYAELQIILLYSQEHEGEDAAREFIGSGLDKFRAPLAGLVHSYRTKISVAHASWLTEPSLSKRTNGEDFLRLSR
jgi:hypothetical protein